MNRTAEALPRIPRRFHRSRRSEEHSDKSRQEEERRRVNAILALQNAPYYESFARSPSPPPHSQKPQNLPPRMRPDAPPVRRKPLTPREESFLRPPGSMRASGLEQDFNRIQGPYPRSSLPKPEDSWLRDEKVVVSEPGPRPPVLPRQVTDVSETSGQRQDPESLAIEIQEFKDDGSDSNAAVDKMFRHLQKARIEFPSKHFEKDLPNPHSPSDVELALCDLIQAYGSTYQIAHESKEELRARTTEYEALQTRLNNEREEWANKSKVVEGQISALENENGKEKLTISVLREEFAAREQKLDNKITNLQQERHTVADSYKLTIRRLENEMDQLKREHRRQVAGHETAVKEEIKKIKKDYDLRLGKASKHLEDIKWQMTDKFEAEKTRMNNAFFNEKTRLSSAIKSQKEMYESRLAILTEQTEDEKRQMTSDYQTREIEMEQKFRENKLLMEEKLQKTKDQFHMQLGNIQHEYQEEMDRKNTEIEMIKIEVEADNKKMEDAYNAKIVALEIKREQEKKSHRDDVEALMGAIVKRDHFKAMSDRDLAISFQTLANEVDEFARIRWDKRRESTWPFPERALRKSENERRTKQYLVQNTLWVILYERIFCTPFRVLGDEGKSLEMVWIEQYGQDLKSTEARARCPRPTKESEKWKYETMKKCLEGINQSPLELESNHDLKQGYEASLKDVTQELSQELERVASVSSGERQRMSDFVRKAAKLWLEVGQQRYRIFLVMANMGGKPSRSDPAYLNSDGTLDLVATPEIRRMGNAQGDRLDREELVAGCKGVFSVFYAS